MIQTTNETQIITKKERKHKMSETLYLVTGAAGFLGSHVCHQMCIRDRDYILRMCSTVCGDRIH